MAAPSSARDGEGLSLQTLLVASAASAAAAIIVSLFWQQGTIMAAAITPVLVALLRELFHRPAKALSTARSVRRPAAASSGAGAAQVAAGSSSARTTAVYAPAPGALSGATSTGGHLREDETEPFATEPLTDETLPLDPTDATRPIAFGDGDAETRPLEGDAEAETRPLERDGHGEAQPLEPGEAETRPLADAADARTRPLADPVEGETATRPLADDGAAGRPGRGVADAHTHGPVPAARRARGVHGERGARAAFLAALRGRRVKTAIVTGLLAFLIAALVLTVPELIAGRSFTPGPGRTTL